MAVIIPGGFQVTNVDPIDSRFSVANQAARYGLATANVYTGLIVYQQDVQLSFILIDVANVGNSAGWQVVITGGSNNTSSQTISGSLNVLGSITGSLQGTVTSASYAGTASVLLGSVVSASYALTSSFAISASYAPGSGTSVSASYATTSSYALTASYISGGFNSVTSSYAESASNFVITNTLTLTAALMKNTTVNSSILGSNVVASQVTGSYSAAFFQYTATSASNARAGQVSAVWNSDTTTYTDFSTTDIGSTTAVTASVSLLANTLQFNVQTNTAGWKIKTLATYL